MLNERETVLRRFLIFVDACVITLAYVFAFFLNNLFDKSGLTITTFGLALVFAVPFWSLPLYANGMYQSLRTRTYLEILWAVIKSATITFLIMGTFIFLLKLQFMSRFFFLIFFGLSFLFIWLAKTAIFMSSHYVRRQGLNTRRLLIVGTGKRASDFIKKIDQHPEWGFELLRSDRDIHEPALRPPPGSQHASPAYRGHGKTCQRLHQEDRPAPGMGLRASQIGPRYS